MSEQRRKDDGSGSGQSRPQAGGARPASGRPVWVFSAPPPEVIAELSRRFPKTAKLPEEEVRAETEEWLNRGLVARSLGRRISSEAAIREFRLRGGLKGDIFGYNLEHGFLLFSFKEVADRDAVMNRPWIVNGCVLAIEPWRARFVPVAGAILSAVVWLRLPLLPVELWGTETLRGITEEAGDLVLLDDCTLQRRRLGFARVAVRVNLAKPLRPGVLIDGPRGSEWQSFVFEQLSGICFKCGMFHCIGGDCVERGHERSAGLHPGNTVQTEDLGEGSPVGDQGFGPWLLAVRRWLPSVGKETRGVEKGFNGSGEQGKAGSGEHLPGEVPDGGGWVKPAKVARRCTPALPSSPVGGSGSGSRFGALRVDAGGAPDPLVWPPSAEGTLPVLGVSDRLVPRGAPISLPATGRLALAVMAPSSAGRSKRARPTPKSHDPGVSKEGDFLPGRGSNGSGLEGDFMEESPEQEGDLSKREKGKGKAPLDEREGDSGQFIFMAGGLQGGHNNYLKPIAQDSGPQPASVALASDQAHIEAVGRLRQAIAGVDESSVMTEEPYVEVDEGREGGGCSGSSPPLHQVLE